MSPITCRRDKEKRVLAFLACAVALLLAAAGKTAAQEAVTDGFCWSPLTGEVDVAVVDKYIYNGYVIQDQGPIVQPCFELVEPFYTGSGLLTSASAKFSLFNSLQSREDGASHTAAPGPWIYETEYNAGFDIELAKRLTVSLLYVRFESPIDAYRRIWVNGSLPWLARTTASAGRRLNFPVMATGSKARSRRHEH